MNNTTQLKGIAHKIEQCQQEAATILGILPLKPGRKFWSSSEIDWDDSRVDHLRETYFELCAKYSKVQDSIELSSRDAALKEANHFLNTSFNSFEEEAKWLKKHGLNTLSLAEKILQNPNFLNEVEV